MSFRYSQPQSGAISGKESKMDCGFPRGAECDVYRNEDCRMIASFQGHEGIIDPAPSASGSQSLWSVRPMCVFVQGKENLRRWMAALPEEQRITGGKFRMELCELTRTTSIGQETPCESAGTFRNEIRCSLFVINGP